MSEIIGNQNETPLVSCAFSGGAAYAIAVGMAYGEKLQENGIDIQHAPMLGTSGGSWVAGLLATGRSREHIEHMPQVQFPNFQPNYIREMADEVFGDDMADNVKAVAVTPSILWPFYEHEVLSGGKHRLADIISASSSIPGGFFPTLIDRKLYFDGGVRSLISADLADRAQHLVAVSCFGGKFMPPVGWLLDQRVQAQAKKWQRRHGGEVTLLRPNAEVSRMIRKPMDVFNYKLAWEAYDATKEHAQNLIDEGRILGGLALHLTQRSA